MSDRVCVLNDGHIEQLGQPDELYHRPRTRFVAGFIGRNNFIPGTVDSNGRRFVFESGRSIPVDPGDSDGAAVLAVRPERLKVTMGASEDAVPARVIRNRFLGDRIEMDLQIEDGPVVSLYENGTAVGSSDEVYVLFPQEHCHVLPPE